MWQPTFEGPKGAYKANKPIYTQTFMRTYLAPCDISFGNAFAHQDFINRLKQDPNGFTQCLNEYLSGYKTQNVAVMMGDDFTHINA